MVLSTSCPCCWKQKDLPACVCCWFFPSLQWMPAIFSFWWTGRATFQNDVYCSFNSSIYFSPKPVLCSWLIGLPPHLAPTWNVARGWVCGVDNVFVAICSDLPRQCRVARKPLMRCWRILGLYGLENSTNQCTLLTVYLFRTFLFSKPSNVHFFIQHLGLVLHILIFLLAGGPGWSHSTQVCVAYTLLRHKT